MNDPYDADRSDDRQALLRFDFVAPPLGSPPPTRALHQTFEEFETKTWKHSIANGTIESSVPNTVRWLYLPPSHPEDPAGTPPRGPRRVVLEILDSCSPLACDVFCYAKQARETLIHTLSQVIRERGVPRAFSIDNGSLIIATEPQAAVGDSGSTHSPALCPSQQKTQQKRPITSHSPSRKRGDLR